MNKALSQYFTPFWVAELLVEQFFPDLTEEDAFLEPSCGDGRFLSAIPAHVPAIGVEIDPMQAAIARKNSGRQVVTGDFLTVDINFAPTKVIGNPPFKLDLIDGFLDRCFDLLPPGGNAGFILPCYAFQTASRVARYARRWSLSQSMIPKNIFPRMEKPLLFAMFTKDRKRMLSGFALYQEADAICQLPRRYKRLFVGNDAPRSTWGAVIEQALVDLGGKAHLSQIYAAIEGKQPSANPWWKEQIRAASRRYFEPLGEGHYQLNEA